MMITIGITGGVRKDKYLWGVITGLAYYVLLLTVSVITGRTFE